MIASKRYMIVKLTLIQFDRQQADPAGRVAEQPGDDTNIFFHTSESPAYTQHEPQ